MDASAHITIWVRKYSWKEFVYDVYYVLFAACMITNALSKRYLKHSIPELYIRIHDAMAWFFVSMNFVLKNSIMVFLLIMFGVFGMVYTAGIPIILFFMAIGRIQ